MNNYPVVIAHNMLRKSVSKRASFIKHHIGNADFIFLIWLSVNRGIIFREKFNEVKPSRPKRVFNNIKEFRKLVENYIQDPFNNSIIEDIKRLIANSDELSAYIYSKALNKNLGVTMEMYNKVIPNGIQKVPYEIPSFYGKPRCPCILQRYKQDSIEAVVVTGTYGTFIKNKAGVPIAGFDRHLVEFSKLGYGTFIVILEGQLVLDFIANSKGGTGKQVDVVNLPIKIKDKYDDALLIDRLLLLEEQLINSDIDPQYVTMVQSTTIDSIDDIPLSYKETVNGIHYRLLARQNTKPILWKEGSHCIDVSYLQH